jgi:hypothetical protein
MGVVHNMYIQTHMRFTASLLVFPFNTLGQACWPQTSMSGTSKHALKHSSCIALLTM